MALFDFLRRKKEVEKSKKPAKKPDKILAAKKAEKEETKRPESAGKTEPAKSAPSRAKNVREFSYEAVKRPHISEKASYLAQTDQYIFEVSPRYNKEEIKNAVEGIYGVDVLSVNMIKIPSKKRRLGRTEGFRKAYKKAVVTIKQGQKIEIL